MMNIWKKITARPDVIFILLMIAFVRLVPHPWNLTPIGATGLFAGAYCNRRWAWLIPLIPLAIGDIFTGGYSPVVMLCVYTGFAGTALIGGAWMHYKVTALRLGGAVLSGSLWFFLISNFGVWLAGMYGYTWSGLIECYLMAIPYYGNTLAGDTVYSLLFFGAYHLLTSSYPNRPATA